MQQSENIRQLFLNKTWAFFKILLGNLYRISYEKQAGFFSRTKEKKKEIWSNLQSLNEGTWMLGVLQTSSPATFLHD